MFANRYTALIDACTLADTLRRNLLLTLAEAEFFRLRWSTQVLDETQAAIEQIRQRKGHTDAAENAARARRQMEEAFEDATILDFDTFLPMCAGLPDPKDTHVLAAALISFADQYARAREAQADALFDDILDIADTTQIGVKTKEAADGSIETTLWKPSPGTLSSPTPSPLNLAEPVPRSKR
ncbi:hypothetical protein ACHMW7_05805 [Aminobacter sp. UC22_36]|uniref:terminase small subunit-like protein n=1 Tax=Aminobacter sp. UC22_36 TaxID=3374549 RepID=UPI0037569476